MEKLEHENAISTQYDKAAAAYRTACMLGDKTGQQKAATTMLELDRRLKELGLE